MREVRDADDDLTPGERLKMMMMRMMMMMLMMTPPKERGLLLLRVRTELKQTLTAYQVNCCLHICRLY